MLAAVVAEGVAIALLAVLVLGLLRSHALILKALHDLGAGLELDRQAGRESASPSQPAADRSDPGPVPVELQKGVVGTPPQRAVGAVGDVYGRSLEGQPRRVEVTAPGSRTFLAFLTSGCHVCATFWDEFSRGVETPGQARLVVVAKDSDEESPSTLRRLAGGVLEVVQSSAAWDAYDIPGSPYFVQVEGGRVIGEGSATTWPQVRELIDQAVADAAEQGSSAGRDPGEGILDRGERDNPMKMEDELRRAGITPGHPSLYPVDGPDHRTDPPEAGRR